MSTSLFSFVGTHVAITGASGGVGLVAAKVFLENGAKVSLQYNTQMNTLKDLLSEFPDHAVAIKASATSETDVAAFFETASAREYMKQLEEATKKGGQLRNVSIVMVGSTAGKFGEAYHADYSVTKSAMMYGLTLSLKVMLIHFG
ncbi:hypothetical protein HDV05_000997 [Chytridiales sp. JEL 0842]|nr:hypothetical protein HDV05_000997 [Chytridiales sp. JEL 0842]